MDISKMKNRNDSMASDMGQADQYVTPSINIEPAPVSRQASFEVETKTFAVADALQPPASKSCQSCHTSPITNEFRKSGPK